MKKLLLFISVAVIFAGTAKAQQDTFSRSVGGYTLYLLSEGQSQGNPSILIDAGQEILGEYIPDGTFPNAVNAFLLITPDGRNILFDTGYGKKLFDNMASIGLSPEDISEVRLTHMHGDHIAGMFRDGELSFPNADVYVAGVEKEYWTSETEMNKIAENRRGSFTNAQEVFRRYAGKLNVVNPLSISDIPSGDGIYPVEAYGHTPGHIGYMIVSGGEKLLIWGDLTHAMAVQMPHPEIAVTYDVDPETAVQSRLRILSHVAAERIPIAGMHIPYPGIGIIETSTVKGYRFIPADRHSLPENNKPPSGGLLFL